MNFNRNLLFLLPCSIYFILTLHSSLMSILEPSACVNLNCRYYASCVVNSVNVAKCVCPANCSTFERRAICGSNGQTYVNECSMKSSSCKEKRIVGKAYDGECGKIFFSPPDVQQLHFTERFLLPINCSRVKRYVQWLTE